MRASSASTATAVGDVVLGVGRGGHAEAHGQVVEVDGELDETRVEVRVSV